MVAGALLNMAAKAEGEPLGEAEWLSIKHVATCLADLIDAPSFANSPLASFAQAWGNLAK